MLEDIVSWSAEHPEPSTLFLIVGDTSRDFLDVVQLLKSKKNYNFIIYNFILYVYYQKTEHSYLAPIPSILLI